METKQTVILRRLSTYDTRRETDRQRKKDRAPPPTNAHYSPTVSRCQVQFVRLVEARRNDELRDETEGGGRKKERKTERSTRREATRFFLGTCRSRSMHCPQCNATTSWRNARRWKPCVQFNFSASRKGDSPLFNRDLILDLIDQRVKYNGIYNYLLTN